LILPRENRSRQFADPEKRSLRQDIFALS
jgi:hypothetical protein